MQAREAYQWHRHTLAETFARIVQQPAFPWVALGDFLDDWRRTSRDERLALVEQPPVTKGVAAEATRWAAFCAATVEWLCWQDELPFPAWTQGPEYRLAEPWFLYPGHLLRAWQLATTPAPFKLRNIFGGDRMLSRV